MFNRSVACGFIFAVLLLPCAGGAADVSLKASDGPLPATDVPLLVTDVPLVKQTHLQASHWLRNAESLVMTAEQIQGFNQKLFQNNPFMQQPLQLPDSLSREQLLAKIESISAVPSSARFYPDGRQLTEQDFADYRGMLNLAAIQTNNPIRFGLVVRRSALRTFPTSDRVLNSEMDADLDRFQESAVFPAEPVAILHSSRDGHWLLVQNYHYIAWMRAADVAIGGRDEIRQYHQQSDTLVITGARVFTAFVPQQPQISQVQLDMGVRIPLVQDVPVNVHGQNPYASYVVSLPVRNEFGRLVFATALIGKTQDVHRGYLPMTRDNILAQAFKFLGERYGWGHDYNGRDCTGFIGEIYKTFGLLMPRNSGQQGQGEYGQNWRFTPNSAEQVTQQLKALQVGDLIYIPGHVMMYIGEEDGQPYVIHDVKGLAYPLANGEFYRGTLNGVSVTPVLPLHLSPTTRYIDRVYAIKRLMDVTP